jgi:hypothetical protein
MLGPGRYLLGVLEIALLGGFAWIGAARVRSRLLPAFRGAPAHLGTAVLALALLIWCAELLGTISLFQPLPFVVAVAAAGISLRLAVPAAGGAVGGPTPEEASATAGGGGSPAATGPAAGTARPGSVPTALALLVAAIALAHFAWNAKAKLSTGMTGFDSTWYHGPFAAGFFQSGDTMDLHFIAPQFLAWFYPANGEIFHAVGMLAFGRDILSPLLNLGWFVGCLVACWCIGRPHRVQAWSLALGAVALSVPALADQAGEARNDVVGIFFLLAAVAIALNAWAGRGEREKGVSTGAMVVTGLAAGLAAGTKLNFLLPAAVLVLGSAAIQGWLSRPGGGDRDHSESSSPARARAAARALAAAGLAALAGGGYWYLRNLVHSGNPLPWIHHLGPISLPAPEQGLGGREAHSVLGYLTDGTVWSDWFLPGLHHGLWIVWPLLGAAALAGLALALLAFLGSFSTKFVPEEPRDGEPLLALAGLVGLATALAWLIAPTSASGPDGTPRGFESGLRYLAPALVLGLALLPAAPELRRRLQGIGGRSRFVPHSGRKLDHSGLASSRVALGIAAAAVLLAVAIGYPVQRHYLQDRYSDPTFSAPGLDAAFAWADDISGARIATTSTRQYPLFGTDLSNRVQFVGEERPHGGFEAPGDCRHWREELNAGRYDYVVASRDRLEPGKPPFPPQASWTEGPWAKVILRKPPTVVFQLTGRLDPSVCP